MCSRRAPGGLPAALREGLSNFRAGSIQPCRAHRISQTTLAISVFGLAVAWAPQSRILWVVCVLRRYILLYPSSSLLPAATGEPSGSRWCTNLSKDSCGNQGRHMSGHSCSLRGCPCVQTFVRTLLSATWMPLCPDIRPDTPVRCVGDGCGKLGQAPPNRARARSCIAAFGSPGCAREHARACAWRGPAGNSSSNVAAPIRHEYFLLAMCAVDVATLAPE